MQRKNLKVNYFSISRRAKVNQKSSYCDKAASSGWKRILDRFMDIKVRRRQHEPSDETVNPNLVIILTMKKNEGSSGGAGSSACDTNNNDGGAVKVVKKESAAKEFCKNLLKKSTSSGDKNNNQSTPPVTNQYTKVTVDGLMSQLNLAQNRQMMNQLVQHRNLVGVNQIDSNKR